MKKLNSGSFILDTSIGVNNALYFSPNVKGKQDLYDQNLQCNLFLFLSIVHGNQTLNRLFIQRCTNKDKFLQLFDTQQFSILLTKVLQIVNQYFTDHQTVQVNKSQNYSNIKQHSYDKYQSMMKKIMITPTSKWQNESMISTKEQKTHSLSQKLLKTNILKEQLKDKITKLAMQNSYYSQFKFLKTDAEVDQNSQNKILKESESQTMLSQQSAQKPNRISFGSQNLFTYCNQDQVVECKLQSNQKIESSPTFLHQQYEDHEVQTSEQDLSALRKRKDQILDQTQQVKVSPADHRKKRVDGTFGKERNVYDKERKKSNSVSESISPDKTVKSNCEILSIDQVQRKRKISTNSINRHFNILTNEEIE